MTSITTINGTDAISTSRTTLNTNFSNLNSGKTEKSGDTMTGQLNFSGTDHAGLKVLSLTEAQRDALTPANGMIIYNTTATAMQAYENGSWVNIRIGVSDMSTTDKGVAEEATLAEIDADAAAGGTGSRLAVNPSTLATSKYGTRLPSADEKSALAGTSGTPSGTNKYVTNDDVSATSAADKVVRAGGAGKIADGFLPITAAQATDLTDGGASTAHYHALPVTSGVASQAKNTTGNQTIAHGLGVTPSFMVFYSFGNVEDTYTTLAQGVGTCIADLTQKVNYASKSSGSTNDARSGTSTSYVIYMVNGAGTVNASAKVSAVDATNITLNWDVNVNEGDARTILWMAYK